MSLISGDVHGLIRVRKSQARVAKYMRNIVPLTPSQTTKITARSMTTTRKMIQKIKRFQHIIEPKLMSNANPTKMRRI